jgi:hypothetical protein
MLFLDIPNIFNELLLGRLLSALHFAISGLITAIFAFMIKTYSIAETIENVRFKLDRVVQQNRFFSKQFNFSNGKLFRRKTKLVLFVCRFALREYFHCC